MAQSHSLLLDYLRHANPAIDRSHCRPGTNTRDGSRSKYGSLRQPKEVREWDDFSVSSLDTICNGILGQGLRRQYQFQPYPVLAEFPFREIHEEDSFKSLLIGWTWQIVSAALAAVQDEGLKHPSGEVYMVRGGQAEFPAQTTHQEKAANQEKAAQQEKRRFEPDWAGARRRNSEKPLTILPGETKISTKWTSAQVPPVMRYGMLDKDKYRPIGQIYRYCLFANARYGYLITDEELVAVRIDLDNSNDQPATVVRYKSIPWRNHSDAGVPDPELMTVNLGLWILHFAAAWDGQITTDEDILYELRQREVVPTPISASARTRGTTTPAGSRTGSRRRTEELNSSFRSETSGIRNNLSGVLFETDGSQSSATPSRRNRKRGSEDGCEDESMGRRRKVGRPAKNHP
ncbi:MAG: hypothetical protein Q9197_006603 [Variospora fuerteventurae]